MEVSKLNYSVAEASARLGIGRVALYRLIGAGSLKVVKLGRRTLVPETSLQEFQTRLIESGSQAIGR